MKRKNNIENKNKKRIDSELNMDQILGHYNIEYSEIDFKNQDIDTLKSLKSVNKRLSQNSNYLKNLKSFLTILNLKPVLKPLYTIALTSILILTLLKLNNTSKPVQYAEVSVDAGEKITLHITNHIPPG